MEIKFVQRNYPLPQTFIDNSVITLSKKFRPSLGFGDLKTEYKKDINVKYGDDTYPCTLKNRVQSNRAYIEFVCYRLNKNFEPNEKVTIYLKEDAGEQFFEFVKENEGTPFVEPKLDKMERTVKIYNINSEEASNNMAILLHSPYLYWDIKRFENDEVGSEVFFIWREGQRIIYSKLLEGKFNSKYNKEKNITEFIDDGKSFNAAGEWGEFIKFEVIDEAVIQTDWDFTKNLGNQNPVCFLYKYQSRLDDIPMRLQKLEDLKKIFNNENTQKRIDEVVQLLVGKPENKDIDKEKIEEIQELNDKTPDQIITHVHDYIQSRGLKYQKEEIANFYLALKAKPFVILAGISGTGKSQLPRKFAASLGFSKEQVILLPVRPDWTDSSDLLGYTSLDGNFIPKDLTLAIQKATANPNKPYFFILDEMNLARVEHYFSDFLSVVETRERVGKEIKTLQILREEVLKGAKNKNDFTAMGWPQNLYLIGTVNMDETTHAFSRKVLDRANSIEMNEVDLTWIKQSPKVDSITSIGNSFFLTEFLTSDEINDDERKGIEKEMLLLQEVNKILQKADLHFAYRVRDEVAFYLIINKKHNLMDDDIAFDFQLVQKVLPRIHGSSERVQTVLVELLNLLEGKDFRSSNFEFSMLENKIDINSLKYRRASKKIIFMLKRFDDDRFTSFWL